MSGEGHGSAIDVGALVSVAEVVAALLLAASECWFGEVGEDALWDLVGRGVVLVQQGANLGVVQGQHAVEICLLATKQVQAAGAAYPVLASAAPYWGESGAEEGHAPWVHGIAAVQGILGVGSLGLALDSPVSVCVVQSLA